MQLRPAKKISIYLNENQQFHHVPAAQAILEFLRRQGAAGAMLVHGTAGFGAHHRLHSAEALVLSSGLPEKIEWIETAAKAEELLPRVAEMAGGGLIEVRDTAIYSSPPRGAALAPPGSGPEGPLK